MDDLILKYFNILNKNITVIEWANIHDSPSYEKRLVIAEFSEKFSTVYLLAGPDDFTGSVLDADIFQWDPLFLHLRGNECLPVPAFHFDQTNLQLLGWPI